MMQRLCRLRTGFVSMLAVGVLVLAAGAVAGAAHAADAKPSWQAEWEKVLAAAKKEGQVSIYISGYEEVLPEFQKEYPEIKVIAVTGRGSQVAQRMIAERRGDKYLADVFNSGGVTTYGQLYAAKVLDPIKPALILPEITDVTKWYLGKHHYNDPENQYVFSYVGSATYGSVSYNTKLVDVKDFKSYWDLLNPKWKGKIISRDIRAPGPGSGNARLFYHLPDVGPSFIRKFTAIWIPCCSATTAKAATGSRSARRRSASSVRSMFQKNKDSRWIHLVRALLKKARVWCSSSAR